MVKFDPILVRSVSKYREDKNDSPWSTTLNFRPSTYYRASNIELTQNEVKLKTNLSMRCLLMR